MTLLSRSNLRSRLSLKNLTCALAASALWGSLGASPSALAAPKRPAKAPPAKSTKTPAKTAKPAAKPARPASSSQSARPIPTVAPMATPAPEPTPTPTPEVGPRTFALLVGVGKYAAPTISPLAFPAGDAQGLKKALTDPKLGNIPADRVLTLTDAEATKDAILNAVDFFKPKMRADDRMIVFLAGHGIAKDVGAKARSWFLPHDVRGFTTPALVQSAVEMRVLSQKLGELPASEFVIFVDACREDPTPGRGLKGNAMSDVLARSVQVSSSAGKVQSSTIFACSVGQRAYEDPSLKHGVFTYYILKGLQDPDLPKVEGYIEAGYLADYVTKAVRAWARKIAEEQDIEIEQSPELVAGEVTRPMQILAVRGATRSADAAPAPPLPSRLGIFTTPNDALVKINQSVIGKAPIIYKSPQAATVMVEVSAPGYPTAKRPVTLLGGYSHRVDFDLGNSSLGSRNAGTPAVAETLGLSGSSEDPLEQQALKFEAQGEWEKAAAAYMQITEAKPKSPKAYERLAELRRLLGEPIESIQVLATLQKNVPSARSLALLSRAYSSYTYKLAAQEASTPGKAAKRGRVRVDIKNWIVPATSWEAAEYAKVAAENAIRLEAKPSAPVLVARGLASIASDEKGKNKNEAMGFLGRAALDESDPEAQYALGLGIRYFAQSLPEAARKAEMERARRTLDKAIALRPNFYEARREMAYCAHLMGDRELALREYEIASSYRGAASDADEVAGLEVSMSALHKQAAQEETDPEKKKQHEEASEGYMEEAKETSGDKELKLALSLMQAVGLRSSLMAYLPAGAQRIFGAIQNPEGALKDVGRDAINKATGGRLPGGFGLPF
jgi:tetratricopeptide (TPR) repeat protein/uncharacterized caspase-like protein